VDAKPSEVWPIFVPSKGRPQSKLLARLLTEGLRFTAVVEPQDFDAYLAALGPATTLTLPEDNRGLVFSRNHVLSTARERGLAWFWMIDDDIAKFHRFEGTKGTETTAREALLAAQAEALPGVGQIALEYQQFAWSSGGKVKVNSYNDVCVAIRTAVPVAYRAVPLKEDRDLTMQIIRRGYDTRRVTQYAFSCPSVGSNKGGLHDEYAAGRDVAGAAELVRLWPWCSEVKTKPNRRVDAKIHWKKVRLPA
jgi:TET-associated glycosyltransferase-like protein